MRYTFEQRKRAVELYIECGKSVSAVRGKLGYPSRQAMYDWYAGYVEHGFRPDHRPHRKFTDEQKRAAVDHYLSHGKRAAATMRALGYPARKGLLAEWIDELAPGERRVRAKSSTYADGRKIDAVVDMETRSGRGADVAADHGVERAVIYKWKRGLLGMGKTGSFSDFKLSDDPVLLKAQVVELQREVRRLRLQKDILQGVADILKKETGADPAKRLTNREKSVLASNLRGEWGLKAVLGELGLPRSSYQYQLAAMARDDRHRDLREAVSREFNENRGRYGRRRIKDALAARGIRAGERLIARIMREEGLAAKRSNVKPRRYSSYGGEVSEHPGNKVLRDFRSALPNRLWLTDVTQFSIPAGKVYLSPIVDCFDGAVVSWTLTTAPNAEMANGMLRRALESTLPEDREGLMIHSDCGLHYRWSEWISICERAGVARSMSKKGCSPDNSAMEGFFGRLKVEAFRGVDWDGVTIDGFMDEIDRYIRWYNEKRIKRSLGGMSPMQYRRSLGVA